MKISKIFYTALPVVLVLALFGNQAWARGHGGGRGGHGWHGHGGFHGHSGFGFYFGSPFYSYPFYSPYYRYPYDYPYYYSPIPSAPPVYIQQSRPVTREYPAGYWYYCENPGGYYPYVKECPGGWLQVEPTPPASK